MVPSFFSTLYFSRNYDLIEQTKKTQLAIGTPLLSTMALPQRITMLYSRRQYLNQGKNNLERFSNILLTSSFQQH